MNLLKKTYPINNLKFLIILFSFCFPLCISAQELNGVLIMSSTGSIQNLENNSMTVIFNSINNCLNLQNGIAVLTGERGIGLFNSNCELNSKFNTLGIILFPNPVVANAKVKFKNMPPLSDIFSLSVWSAEGYNVYNIKASGFEIFHGKLIDFNNLIAGTYFIQIESDKYIDALKFIKSK